MTREEYETVLENGSVRECIIASGAYINSLEQQNTALQQERANMQITHRNTIAKLEARIKELEKPVNCRECKHLKWSSPLNDFVCEEGVSNDVSKLGSGCITMPSVFNCSFYEPKQN